jgi:hypothetical protein
MALLQSIGVWEVEKSTRGTEAALEVRKRTVVSKLNVDRNAPLS